jgi:tRNA intron endonuclease, catalytic C-terminal domain
LYYGFQGFFGEFNYVTPYDPDRPKIKNHFRSDIDPFPPGPHVFPVASLNLVEAYFLNYICGSLDIWDGCSQKKLLRQNLMQIFTQLDPLFPYFFAAYVYFRHKKYTVKSGIKFGTDFG